MTNIFTLLSVLLLMPLFYLFQFVLKKPKPWFAVLGLLFLTAGQWIDGQSAWYYIPTVLSALFVLYGATREPP